MTYGRLFSLPYVVPRESVLNKHQRVWSVECVKSRVKFFSQSTGFGGFRARALLKT